MSRPHLWLYLLAAVTVLVIALRRVLHRQKPLNDALYSKQVAIDHVQSGVAWVRADGKIGALNPAMAEIFHALPEGVIDRNWETLFPETERARIQEAYSQALLMGKTNLESVAQLGESAPARVNVLLVTVHDHKSRLVGHYVLMENRTRELELEEQVQKLNAALELAAHSGGR